MKKKGTMVGKKTLAKHILLEKIAFGYVLIEREKLFPGGGKKKRGKKQQRICY